jgi:hypothetical protein
LDCNWRTIWIVDAHRDGKRFVVRADEVLAAFWNLESAHSHLQKNQDEEIECKRAPIVTSTVTWARFELVK